MKNQYIALTTILLVLARCMFSVETLAVTPAPDGGYAGGNTAEGQNTLLSLTTGAYNTAVGFLSLSKDTTGSLNTAIGAGALVLNTADQNTATGAAALLSTTTGQNNVANGAFALFSNTVGIENTALGSLALFSHASGSDNVAVGYRALYSDQTGLFNDAVGRGALSSNVTGGGNTAVGDAALTSSTGNDNTAVGISAGANLTSGGGNVYIGSGAAVPGVANENGHTYIANINTTAVNGESVTVDSTTGLLGHLASSRRYKEDIKPMDDTSQALYRLKPVTYRYKKEIDATQSPAFGLIAEEVADVNPSLVARNAKGQPESVHYEMVNSMLLNEFLKEHRKIEQLEKQIGALTASLQKVSSQLELSKNRTRTIAEKSK
jgi:hypothetical protein